MIRLIDCEVYAVEKNEITRYGLFSFFCNNHTEDFVSVYSNGVYEGVISYQKLLHTSSESIDDLISKEKYICKQNDLNLFSNLSKMTSKKKDSLVTLTNWGGEILYFAYNDETNEYAEIEQSMKNLEKSDNKTDFFLEDIYPNVKKVWIENLNEFAYRFYNILRKVGMPVEVCGEKWTVLFPELCKKQEDFTENKILKIHAEGIRNIGFSMANDICKEWKFLIEIGRLKHNYITEKYRKNLKMLALNV